MNDINHPYCGYGLVYGDVTENQRSELHAVFKLSNIFICFSRTMTTSHSNHSADQLTAEDMHQITQNSARVCVSVRG